jgi:HK97 family phage portal protein
MTTSETEIQRAAAALMAMTGGGSGGDEERATSATSNPQNPAYWVEQVFGGGYQQSAAGVNVNERTALTFSAVMGCVRILSETLGMLPAFVYRRLPGGGKERLPEHPVYQLIHDDPNDEMVPIGFKETVMAHIVTWGNGFAEIERSGRGIPSQLWPITPDRVRIDRTRDGRLFYDVREDHGPNTTFDPADMLHIPGLGYDGIKGYSPVRMSMQAIGLGLAAETFGSTFFGNGANAGGVLEHPNTLSDTAAKHIYDSFVKRAAGLSNAHNPLILEEGMKFNKWSVPPEEAQFLQTRKFQVEEIARIYRVPPHMLADLDRATFSNIEHQGISFIVHSMMPWFARWEQWLAKKLLTREERRAGLFVEFLVTAMLRGDASARATFYKMMRELGALNADEIREAENMNPLPDGQGKMYLVPLNMAPADKIEEIQKPESAPAPAAKEAPAKPDDERVAILPVLRVMATDAAKRIVMKEILAAKRDSFRSKSDEFFADHPATVTTTLAPIVQAMTLAGLPAVDLGAVTSAHVERAKAGIIDVQTWEQHGPGQLVRALIGE